MPSTRRASGGPSGSRRARCRRGAQRLAHRRPRSPTTSTPSQPSAPARHRAGRRRDRRRRGPGSRPAPTGARSCRPPGCDSTSSAPPASATSSSSRPRPIWPSVAALRDARRGEADAVVRGDEQRAAVVGRDDQRGPRGVARGRRRCAAPPARRGTAAARRRGRARGRARPRRPRRGRRAVTPAASSSSAPARPTLSRFGGWISTISERSCWIASRTAPALVVDRAAPSPRAVRCRRRAAARRRAGRRCRRAAERRRRGGRRRSAAARCSTTSTARRSSRSRSSWPARSRRASYQASGTCSSHTSEIAPSSARRRRARGGGRSRSPRRSAGTARTGRSGRSAPRCTGRYTSSSRPSPRSNRFSGFDRSLMLGVGLAGREHRGVVARRARTVPPISSGSSE